MVASVGEKAENLISVPSIIPFPSVASAALHSSPFQLHHAVKPPNSATQNTT